MSDESELPWVGLAVCRSCKTNENQRMWYSTLYTFTGNYELFGPEMFEPCPRHGYAGLFVQWQKPLPIAGDEL